MRYDEKIKNQYSRDIYVEAAVLFFLSNHELILGLNIEQDKVQRNQALHRIKGSSSMLGFVELTEAIELAEANATKERIILVNELFVAYKKDLDK